MKKFVGGIVSGAVGVFIVLLAAGGIALVALPGQIIHAMGGKTGAEYEVIVGSLNETKGILTTAQTELGNAKSALDKANEQVVGLQGQVGELNSTITGLQGQLSSWNGLVCSHTWDDFMTPNVLATWNSAPNDFFNSIGFGVYVTQWTPNKLDTTKPFTTLIHDIEGEMVFDVSEHCLIFKDPI
jgi:hypothetical protein